MIRGELEKIIELSTGGLKKEKHPGYHDFPSKSAEEGIYIKVRKIII